MSKSIQHSATFQDITGNRYGRLKVLRYVGRTKRGIALWECRCDCGTIKTIMAGSLRRASWPTRSCGCLQLERARTHGMKRTREWSCWSGMKRRCLDPNNIGYKRYGGRGIKVCQKWLHSFEAFFADMGACPSAKHSIDRIDNDGDYRPENCRWATPSEQSRNRRHNRLITAWGRTQALVAWSQETGLNPMTIASRLRKGWLPEAALGTPLLRKRKAGQRRTGLSHR